MVVVAVLVLVGTYLLPLGVLTGIGARRRGAARPTALLAGVAHPLSWAVWYVRDEPPYRAVARP